MALNKKIMVAMPTEKISFSLPNDKGEKYIKYLFHRLEKESNMLIIKG